MESRIVTPEDVLETLMNDGTIDAIRLKIINQLKANVSLSGANLDSNGYEKLAFNFDASLFAYFDALKADWIGLEQIREELKNNTITMVEQSKVLNTSGAEKQTKRELFDSLRRELEAPVLERASRAVWELIIDGNMLGKEISETVERVYCRLSGLEMLTPPASLAPTSEAQEQSNDKEEKDKGKTDEAQETLIDSSSRKRAFSEINEKGSTELVEDDLPAQALAAL